MQSQLIWPLFVAFISGSFFAFLVSSAWAWWNRPVIFASLVKDAGCYVPAIDSNGLELSFLRLRIENTGRTEIQNCSAYCVALGVSRNGTKLHNAQEVLDLSWSHAGAAARSIPRGGFFYLDLVSLARHNSAQNILRPAFKVPFSFQNLFSDAGHYQLEIFIGASNAAPTSKTIAFDYEPSSRDLVVRYDP